MNGTVQFFPENVVDHPLTINARPFPKRFGYDLDAEMSLALGAGADMSGMHVRFVDDSESNRREGRLQFFPYGFSHCHSQPGGEAR